MLNTSYLEIINWTVAFLFLIDLVDFVAVLA